MNPNELKGRAGRPAMVGKKRTWDRGKGGGKVGLNGGGLSYVPARRKG